jgi:hypothetical protein
MIYIYTYIYVPVCVCLFVFVVPNHCGCFILTYFNNETHVGSHMFWYSSIFITILVGMSINHQDTKVLIHEDDDSSHVQTRTR